MNDSFSNFCKTRKTDHVNISRPFIVTLKQDLIFKDIADIWEFASTSRNLDMLLALQAGWEIKFAKIKIQSNGWEDLFKETYGLKVFTTRNKDTYTQNQSRFISIINKVLSQLSILFLAKIVTNFAFWSSTTPLTPFITCTLSTSSCFVGYPCFCNRRR